MMDHSLQSYLERQPTAVLERLLQQYEALAEDDHYADLACLLRTILLYRDEPDGT